MFLNLWSGNKYAVQLFTTKIKL